ncbi:MAG: polysaccharide deacetylase family protein [Acidimicrobiales bacterium]|nr:polysaccharide deacetylase family protein [Acidimicrobiales bacterium]
MIRDRVAQATTAALGARPVARAAQMLWPSRLRVIDFHDVADAGAFERLVLEILGHYHPVSEEQVRAAMAGSGSLPERAVWLTFDDGHRSVVDRGLDVLVRHGVPATFFVCPGLIEEGEPPWWELVFAAGSRGVGAHVGGVERRGEDLVRALKVVEDGHRREVVESLRTVGIEALDLDALVLDRASVDRWLDAGLSIGSHTWDHPCLHRCDEAGQVAQIERADSWLKEVIGRQPSFAYPNGDHTALAESTLAALGYDVALLSDHRLADVEGPPLRMSRLRLSAVASPRRTRAVLSGLHSAIYARALRHRLTGPAWVERSSGAGTEV